MQEDPYYSELVDHYKDFEPRLDDMDTKPVSIEYQIAMLVAITIIIENS